MTVLHRVWRKPGRKKTARGGLRRAGLGALGVLSCMFVASGVVRLASDGQMVADEWRTVAAAWAEVSEERPPAEGDAGIRAPDEVIAALVEREERLDQRERALEERLRALAIAETEFEANLAALIAAEQALRETVALADGAAEADLSQLTRMYETMKPKEAAALFEQMDATFAAGFLGQMKPAAAAEIMAGLTPPTAYTISLVLAGRNMRVPSE